MSTQEYSRRLEDVTLQSGVKLAATQGRLPHLAWAATRGSEPISFNLTDPASTDIEE